MANSMHASFEGPADSAQNTRQTQSRHKIGPPTRHEIDEYLHENNLLIEAILQNQNLGRLHECVQYQLQLQQNLIYLATHADEQPALRPLFFERQPVLFPEIDQDTVDVAE
uniref:SS18 N-terminal domain-containing protein n=1 Tax=Chrysotila carterae TaxID=13221 RepID=A0A7S4C125_CHRCT|mmetsp:Transcript_35345/g.74209  ORF Transcript_35345/g.74209 Transcript_35345/m.74209 type:complete len:111 (+) Transcript_35345:329-661(+)|eukprot:6213942-Pleurochrysis_carterae.AAC.4